VRCGYTGPRADDPARALREISGRGSARALLLSFLIIALVLGAVGCRRRAPPPRFTVEAEEVAAVLRRTSERLALMPAVAAYKWQHQLPVLDVAREQRLLERVAAQAQALGLDASSAQALLRVQMRLAREVQAQAFAGFRARGLAGAPVRDLDTELRPKVERATERLLAELAAAQPSLQRAPLRQRYTADARRVLAPFGVSDELTGELLDALAAVRPAARSHAQRVSARKVLRVGTSGDYAPFSLERGGALGGTDIALVRRFARTQRLAVRFVRTSWSTLVQDLQQGAFDLAVGGISVTAERRARAAFSVPYHHGGKTAIAACQGPRLASLAEIDRPSVRVIVNPGGTNEAFARSRLHSASLRVFPDNRLIFQEIVSGRADVMITDDIEVAVQTRRHRELCRTTPELFTESDKAWLVPAESDLRQAVDAWLAPQVASGAVAQTLSRAIEAASR
jgi:cyclohexadienyl dehydratase